MTAQQLGELFSGMFAIVPKIWDIKIFQLIGVGYVTIGNILLIGFVGWMLEIMFSIFTKEKAGGSKK